MKIHIKLHKSEQLYYSKNDKAIVAVAIDLDRDNHTITIYKYTMDEPHEEEWKTFHTSEIGCCNLKYHEVDEKNVENFDFYDEF